MSKIAVAIITSKLDASFERCIKSLDGHVDRIFIHFNGEDVDSALEWVNPTSTLHTIQAFKWKDDFSLARNQSFQMVDDTEEDFRWLFWVDSDDVLMNGEKLREMLDSLDQDTQGVMLKYEYAVNPSTGEILVEQWRERIFRTDGKWKWVYPLHEVCTCPQGTQMAKRDDVWLRHTRSEHNTDSQTRERNRRILVKARKKEPNEARYKFYMANEIYAEAWGKSHQEAEDLYNAALMLYREFVAEGHMVDDIYMAQCRVAECLRWMEKYELAINAALQCIKVHPNWPEAYVIIAQCCMQHGDWEKCLEWAEMCIRHTDVPKTTQAVEPFNAKFTPYLLRGLARENLGQYEGALEDYKQAASYRQADDVDERIKVVTRILKMPEMERDMKSLRWSLRGRKPDRSIAFVVPPSFEPWHPDIERKSGAGGAETCVMELAKRFAADDWRVAVFGTPGSHKGVGKDGIEWWETIDYTPPERFKVLVASRAPEVFDAPINAEQKYLWMHDVNVGDNYTGEWGNRIDNVDKVLGLSPWHLDHLHRLYGVDYDKLAIVPNGIDLSRFKGLKESKRKLHRFVYSSSPDRGLEVILSMWKEIKNRWADAELHIYYGWSSIDSIIQGGQGEAAGRLTEYQASVVASLEKLKNTVGGVHWHGRVPQKKLARELGKCDYWLYPTYFLETFCITAIEMQAAGVIPLVNGIGALERINPDLQIYGHPNNYETFQSEYLKLMERIVNSDESYKKQIRDEGRETARNFSWERVYDSWSELIRTNDRELVAA